MTYEQNADTVRRLLEPYPERVLSWLELPGPVVDAMEPGTISAVINSLLEADLAHLLADQGVQRCRTATHHRDGYPDFQIGENESSPRVEMKGLWDRILKGNITSSGKSKMEPSARLREPQDDIRDDDVLLIIVWDFEECDAVRRVRIAEGVTPIVCSAHKAAESRDQRALGNGAQFVPGYKVPVTTSGRPETNFGKLNRIPYVREQLGLLPLKVRQVADEVPEMAGSSVIEATSDPEITDELMLGRNRPLEE
jgi:hypothetical protein